MKKHSPRKAVAVVLISLISILFISSLFASNPKALTANQEVGLIDSIKNTPSGAVLHLPAGRWIVKEPIVVPSGKEVILQGDPHPWPYMVIQCEDTSQCIHVEEGAKLKIQDVSIYQLTVGAVSLEIDGEVVAKNARFMGGHRIKGERNIVVNNGGVLRMEGDDLWVIASSDIGLLIYPQGVVSLKKVGFSCNNFGIVYVPDEKGNLPKVEMQNVTFDYTDEQSIQ